MPDVRRLPVRVPFLSAMSHRKRLAALATAVIVIFGATGFLSSRASLHACDGLAQAHISRTVAQIREFHRSQPDVRDLSFLAQPIHWAAAEPDPTSPGSPWYYFARSYRPSNVALRAPWGFVRSEVTLIPFLVRTYYGYQTTGQSGAGGFFLRLCFFGRVHTITTVAQWVS